MGSTLTELGPMQKQVYERGVWTIDDSVNVPVPFFNAINKVLEKHGITSAVPHTKSGYLTSAPAVGEYPTITFALPNLTIVYERSRVCSTPPAEIKSYEADNYNNIARVTLFSSDAKLMEGILEDFKRIKV